MKNFDLRTFLTENKLTNTSKRLDEKRKEIELDRPNEFKPKGKKEVEYRGYTIKKQAYGWYVQGADKVPEINSGKYMGLSFALKDIDKAEG